MYKAEEPHIVVIEPEHRYLFEICIFGNFGMKHVHTEKAYDDHNDLNNKSSKWLSILNFVSANAIESSPKHLTNSEWYGDRHHSDQYKCVIAELAEQRSF